MGARLLATSSQFYIEEGRGHVDYLGYVRPKYGRDAADDEDRLISVQFAWKGEEKNVSTFFVGERTACRVGVEEWGGDAGRAGLGAGCMVWAFDWAP
jgi:hypothetical protein